MSELKTALNAILTEKENKILPENIKSGVQIFDIEGTLVEGGGEGTEDATATTSDVLYPKTFYAKGEKQTGAIVPEYSIGSYTLNTNVTGSTSYYVLDFLPEQNIGIILKTLNDTTLYIAKYDTDTGDYDIDNAFSITASAFGTMVSTYSSSTTLDCIQWFSAAKFGAKPYDEENNIWNVCVQGRNGSWDTKMMGGFRINLTTLTKVGSIIKTRMGESWNIYDTTYWTMSTRPGTHNEWFIVPSALRSNSCHSYRIIINDTNTVSSQQVCTMGHTGKSYGMYDDTGRFCMTFRDNYTRDIYDITNNKHIIQNVNGLPAVIDGTYVFANYTLYNLSGTALKTYSSSDFASGTIIALASKNSVFYVFTTTYINVFNFDSATYKFTLLKQIPNSYYIHSYTYAETTLSFPDYKENYILYGNANNRDVRKVQMVEGEVISSFTRDDVTYHSQINMTAKAANVLNGETFLGADGKTTGTMPNRGYISITPKTGAQAIPSGYISGGIVSGVTSNIDINITPENIKKGIPILGVEGTFEGNTGGDATSDGNLQAKYLLEGYSAVVDGKLIQGTMKDYGTKTIIATNEDIEIPEGHYDSLSIPIINAANCADYTECSQALSSI